MEKSSPRFVTAEIFLIFTFIMAQIWIIPRSGILVAITLLFLIISWRYHKDTLKTVGLLPEDFSQAKPIFIWVLVSVAIMVVIALFINPNFWEQPTFWKDANRQFRRYIGWAVFQQLLLHGYFTNRLQIVFKKPLSASIAAGVLFSLAHLPNPVLAIGTLVFGGASSYFFLKSRNLYILALAHAILGTAVKYLIAAPLLDHPLRIGPDFWN